MRPYAGAPPSVSHSGSPVGVKPASTFSSSSSVRVPTPVCAASSAPFSPPRITPSGASSCTLARGHCPPSPPQLLSHLPLFSPPRITPSCVSCCTLEGGFPPSPPCCFQPVVLPSISLAPASLMDTVDHAEDSTSSAVTAYVRRSTDIAPDQPCFSGKLLSGDYGAGHPLLPALLTSSSGSLSRRGSFSSIPPARFVSMPVMGAAKTGRASLCPNNSTEVSGTFTS